MSLDRTHLDTLSTVENATWSSSDAAAGVSRREPVTRDPTDVHALESNQGNTVIIVGYQICAALDAGSQPRAATRFVTVVTRSAPSSDCAVGHD
jgi:hypothetical protein